MNEDKINNIDEVIRKNKIDELKNKRIRVFGLLFGIITGLIVSIGTIFYVIERSKSYNQLSIIRADQNPFKIKPKEPGGLRVENPDTKIYCKISDCDDEGETILPPLEEPAFSKYKENNLIYSDEDPLKLAINKKNDDNEFLAKEFLIQLAALRSQEKAEKEWDRLLKEYPQFLEKYNPIIVKVNNNQNGVFYRLRAGPIETREKSDTLCKSLKKEKIGCLVVPRF